MMTHASAHALMAFPPTAINRIVPHTNALTYALISAILDPAPVIVVNRVVVNTIVVNTIAPQINALNPTIVILHKTEHDT